MYSVPLRSVQMFLQAMLHVWQPMHLSRWKTIEICERTFIAALLCLPLQLGKFAHKDVRIAVTTGRAPVVEMKCELAVAADHQVGLQPGARQAVVTAGA